MTATMLEFDTPFRRKVRSLKAPNSPEFDARAWAAAIEAGEPTENDLALAATATWLANEAQRLRTSVTESNIPPLSGPLATTLAIATLNREFSVLSGKLIKAQKVAANAGLKTQDQLANVPIRSADGLFNVDAGSRIDAATDAIESWLYEAGTFEGNPPTATDLLGTAIGMVQRYCLQRSHYDLWQQALWEDWRLISREQRLMFVPATQELKELQDAWLMRQQSNFMGYAWLEVANWPHLSVEDRRNMQLPRTVIGVEQRPGRRRRFTVGRPSIARMQSYTFARLGLDGSYLAPFLERSLPAQPELTADLLLRAWYVILDLAEALAGSRPRASFADVNNVRKWALVAHRQELVDVLIRSLELSSSRAESVIEFLSWKKGTYKGLWGAPLVPIPGMADQFALAESVLSTSNVIRRMEIWLSKGKLDDSLAGASRGLSFEAQLRSDLHSAASANPMVREIACAAHGIKKSQNFPEQIDFLVQFGSLLLVGEAKCFLFPADSRERFNYLRNLRSACAQASRKAAAVHVRRDVVATVLGIAESVAERLRVLPIVVLNQDFGVSLKIDNCVVTDSRFLQLYLGPGSYVSEGAVNRVDAGLADVTQHLYRNASEAVEKFEAIMRRPPPIERFRSLLRWGSFAFPTSSGNPLFIAQTEVGDLSRETHMRYEMLKATVDK